MLRAFLACCTVLVALAPPVLAGPPVVTAQPRSAASGFDDQAGRYFRDPATGPAMPPEQLVALLRQRVKYVFVLFQENRSFDHYFGTFPGADGLFADASPTPVLRSPALPSNTQPLYGTDGSLGSVSPFRVGPRQDAADLDDVDHGHARMAAKMDVPGRTGTPRMDRFALDEQAKRFPGSPIDPTAAQVPPHPSLSSRQWGELAMAYVDCDTVPFLWQWASRFVLFDRIFQTTIGPSTPNAIAMISGQSGETQWVRHPDATTPATYGTLAPPITNDPIPGLPAGPGRQYSGHPSEPDNTQVAHNTGEPGTPARKNEGGAPGFVATNLTYASLPLTLAGGTVGAVTAADTNPDADLPDVQDDIAALMARGRPDVGWGWYQNGYDAEPDLPTANGIAATPHASYIGHHNGPQYFGYVTSNPREAAHQHGLGDFFTDLANRALPAGGGVFYVRGGYDNIQGLRPDAAQATGFGSVTAAADRAYVQANFLGDDDHPAYSDSQISEAMLARAIDAIAGSPYWPQSAIVITYDESEGDYDHVPPRILSWDPAGLPLSRGPRIPLLVISPYARSHVVSHEEGDHNSVIGLIDTLFGLTPLADLPAEAQARRDGEAARFATAGVVQHHLGPHDGVANPTPGTGFLLSAFDPARLLGTAPPLPPEFATIDPARLATLPHDGGRGCAAVGITPLDAQLHVPGTAPPADFFARPSLTRE